MYNCGPTVYDYVHIGNLRSFIFADILRRTLEYFGYKVEQTMNITDLGHLTSDADEGEDKMAKGLRREGLPYTLEAMRDLGTKYAETFNENLKELNIESPHHIPRASDSVYISEDLNIIQKLLTKGLAYETADGVYFDTENFPQYGALPGAPSAKESETQKTENHDKKSPRDFALWKKNSEIGFESPYGRGFPGWHIECSAMSMRTLKTETLDIHTGGIDNMPIHHNNEIAQSEGATGKTFARFFMHGGPLTFSGEKMAKSTGNIAKLKDLEENKIHSLSYRFFTFNAHYRSPLDFSYEAVNAAQNALQDWVHLVARIENTEELPSDFKDEFENALADDLDIPKAVSTLQTLLSSPKSDGEKKAALLYANKVFGLDLEKLSEAVKEIGPEARKILEKRNEARINKDWVEADRLRTELENRGYVLSDREKGTLILHSLSSLAVKSQ